MRRIDRAILVEGYFDAIAIDHAGVPGVVASMGTSLTSGQASLLRRFCTKVVIAYDGDDAGRHATLRAAPVLLSAGLTVSALDLQGEKDPDSLVQKHGADRFLELLGNATDIFEFALREWAGDVTKLSGREKSERVEAFMSLLNAVVDPIVRSNAIQKIADELRLPFEAVSSKVRGKSTAVADDKRLTPTSAERMNAEKSVLRAALQGKLNESLVGRLHEDCFEETGCKTIFSLIKSTLQAGNPIDFREIQTHLRGDAEATLLSELTLSDDIDDEALQRIGQNITALESFYLRRRKLEIQREIVEAAKRGDSQREAELDAERARLSRMLNTLK